MDTLSVRDQELETERVWRETCCQYVAEFVQIKDGYPEGMITLEGLRRVKYVLEKCREFRNIAELIPRSRLKCICVFAKKEMTEDSIQKCSLFSYPVYIETVFLKAYNKRIIWPHYFKDIKRSLLSNLYSVPDSIRFFRYKLNRKNLKRVIAECRHLKLLSFYQCELAYNGFDIGKNLKTSIITLTLGYCKFDDCDWGQVSISTIKKLYQIIETTSLTDSLEGLSIIDTKNEQNRYISTFSFIPNLDEERSSIQDTSVWICFRPNNT
ncbi:unnamed protein product [Moneuplotes crassus]|uniref:Uncharacterized protein n=1 Tax=Euplotes crassus TaxID=5936 RepID=A0AAD1XTL1_EUPCR|nr:unnamed protein product [Moneuplotes crassus]